jgi:glycosyltransferase involved in cell wall biosynthesis
MTNGGKDSPLRVLHYSFLNYGMTGVESFILQLCTAQARAGVQPTITLHTERKEALVEAAAKIGVPVVNFAHPVKVPLVRRLGGILTSVKRILALRKLLKGQDVLHLHCAGFDGLDALVAAALVPKRRVIITNHMTMEAYRRHWKRLGSLTLWVQKRVADVNVMPYEEAAQELIDVGVPANKVAVVPYCIDEVRFSGRNSAPAAGEPLRLIMVSRLHEGKGHDVLLDALDALKKKGRAVKLTIVGAGEMRAAIEQQINTLSLQSSVDLLEHVPHTSVPQLLRESHVIVLPSWMEGETFPLCLMEGMMLGLPAIGARWHGIPFIIKDGETGFVVTPKSSSELADAIEKFVADPNLYPVMSEKARLRAQTFYTAKTVASTYESLYRGLPVGAASIAQPSSG